MDDFKRLFKEANIDHVVDGILLPDYILTEDFEDLVRDFPLLSIIRQHQYYQPEDAFVIALENNNIDLASELLPEVDMEDFILALWSCAQMNDIQLNTIEFIAQRINVADFNAYLAVINDDEFLMNVHSLHPIIAQYLLNFGVLHGYEGGISQNEIISAHISELTYLDFVGINISSAIFSNDVANVQLAMTHVDAKSDDASIALLVAIESDNFDVVQFLVDKGVWHRRALETAEKMNNRLMTNYLIDSLEQGTTCNVQ